MVKILLKLQKLLMLIWSTDLKVCPLKTFINEKMSIPRNNHTPFCRLSIGYLKEKYLTYCLPCVVVILTLLLIPLRSDITNSTAQENPIGTKMCSTRNLWCKARNLLSSEGRVALAFWP